jgi:hypothetical protein
MLKDVTDQLKLITKAIVGILFQKKICFGHAIRNKKEQAFFQLRPFLAHFAQGMAAGNVQSGGTERRTYVAYSPTRLAKRSSRFFFGTKFATGMRPNI